MKRILSFYLRDQHPWKGIVRSRISAFVFPFTNPMIDSAQTGALVVAKTEEKGRDSLKHSNRRNKRTAVRRRVTKRGQCGANRGVNPQFSDANAGQVMTGGIFSRQEWKEPTPSIL